MTLRFLFALVLLAVSLPRLSADEAAPLVKEVVKALRQLNDAFVSRNAGVLKKLMTEDHVSITPYAGKEGRAKQIEALTNFKIEKYSTEGMKSQTVTKDSVLLTYVVNYNGTYAGKALPARALASSLWVLRDGQWREALYQETAVAKE